MQAAPQSSGGPAPEPTEIVHRPQPGTLQSGRYEAPSWTFYVAAGAVVLLALLYFALRLRAFRLHRRDAAAGAKPKKS